MCPVTIKIIALKEVSAFSESTISIFPASKRPKPKSNKNFHFFHLLSGRLISIYKKHRKFNNSIYWRYMENHLLLYSENIIFWLVNFNLIIYHFSVRQSSMFPNLGKLYLSKMSSRSKSKDINQFYQKSIFCLLIKKKWFVGCRWQQEMRKTWSGFERHRGTFKKFDGTSLD